MPYPPMWECPILPYNPSTVGSQIIPVGMLPFIPVSVYVLFTVGCPSTCNTGGMIPFFFVWMSSLLCDIIPIHHSRDTLSITERMLPFLPVWMLHLYFVIPIHHSRDTLSTIVRIPIHPCGDVPIHPCGDAPIPLCVDVPSTVQYPSIRVGILYPSQWGFPSITKWMLPFLPVWMPRLLCDIDPSQ